jgi:hypothetical protein
LGGERVLIRFPLLPRRREDLAYISKNPRMFCSCERGSLSSLVGERTLSIYILIRFSLLSKRREELDNISVEISLYMSRSNHNQSSLLLIRSKAMRTEVQPLRVELPLS